MGVLHTRTHNSLLKVKVTFGGQRSKFCNLYLVSAINSQVIVLSSVYLVEMFILTCSYVVYKNYDSRSRSHLEVKGQYFVIYTLSGPYLYKLLLNLHDTW